MTLDRVSVGAFSEASRRAEAAAARLEVATRQAGSVVDRQEAATREATAVADRLWHLIRQLCDVEARLTMRVEELAASAPARDRTIPPERPTRPCAFYRHGVACQEDAGHEGPHRVGRGWSRASVWSDEHGSWVWEE